MSIRVGLRFMGRALGTVAPPPEPEPLLEEDFNWYPPPAWTKLFGENFDWVAIPPMVRIFFEDFEYWP